MDTERMRVGAGIAVLGVVLLAVGHTAASTDFGSGLVAVGWVVLVVGLVMVAVGLLRGRPN